MASIAIICCFDFGRLLSLCPVFSLHTNPRSPFLKLSNTDFLFIFGHEKSILDRSPHLPSTSIFCIMIRRFRHRESEKLVPLILPVSSFFGAMFTPNLKPVWGIWMVDGVSSEAEYSPSPLREINQRENDACIESPNSIREISTFLIPSLTGILSHFLDSPLLGLNQVLHIY